MTVYATPTSTHAVFVLVDNMNALMNSTPHEHERKGVKLALARRKAEAKRMKDWHESATKARAEMPVSRQVRRRMARDQQKSLVAAYKRSAKRR